MIKNASNNLIKDRIHKGESRWNNKLECDRRVPRYRCSWINTYFMPFKNFINAFKVMLPLFLATGMFAFNIYVWNL